MPVQDQAGMSHTDSAVRVTALTKEFTQWQRDNTFKGVLRNMLRPEKLKVMALDGVSFNISKGDFVAYAGPNGAGKSTTMKLLAGMLAPTSGDIVTLGYNPQKQRRTLMKRLGILFGNRTELWWDHPIIQSFQWKKAVWDIPDALYKKNLNRVTELLGLEGLLKTFARELSLGQRMRADLAMMLLHAPELLLLDEPTLGLDVTAKRDMIAFLKQLNREDGATIIVTSHDMDDLEEMTRRILILSDGKLAYDGPFDGLRAVTGNLTRLTVRADTMPSLPGAALVSAGGGVYAYNLDTAVTPVRNILCALSETSGIQDIEINKAPIEQVIAALYASWENKKG